MSANQIPGPPLSSTEWDGRPRPHSCPTCWKNGGPGYTYAEKLLISATNSPTPAKPKTGGITWRDPATTR